MKHRITKYAYSICISLYLFIAGCSDSPTETADDMVDSGSWYESSYHWPHDGQPVESDHFVVFSDGASLEARQQLLQICEDVFATIVEKLDLTDLSILQFPEDRDNKIHVYAYKYYYPLNWGGQAFYGGYIIYSLDHPQRRRMGLTELDSYSQTVSHEMMHVIQTLIVGDNLERIYTWFAEGIAIEISESDFYTRIDTQSELDDLTSTWGDYNPISFHHSWDYPDIEGIGVSYLYPMFWLAVRYLADPVGQGGSYADVLAVMKDVANDISFEASIENRFGISYADYEDQFFDLMNDYLP